MPKLTGTATEFILETLRCHADRECSIGDLHKHCGGRFSKDNLQVACKRLFEIGRAHV